MIQFCLVDIVCGVSVRDFVASLLFVLFFVEAVLSSYLYKTNNDIKITIKTDKNGMKLMLNTKYFHNNTDTVFVVIVAIVASADVKITLSCS